MAKLGEICAFQSGGTPSKNKPEYFGGEIPWISTTALNGGKINETDAVAWITPKAIRESAAKIVPANSIMIGTRVGIGKVAINTVEMSTSQDVISLINIDEDKWYKPYLCKLLLSKKDYFNSQARGATIKGIKIDVVANIDVPEIDYATQRKVAATLNKIDTLIVLRKQQLAKLDELVKARFVEMFGDSVANTKNFPSTTLETVMTVFPQNGLYKPQTDYVQDNTGIPILRIDAFYNGKVTNWNTLKRLICSETEINRYLLRENDIVINRVNSIEYLGKCAHIVGLKEKTVFESNMMRFHMDEKKVNAVYVTEVLCTEDIYRQILRRAKKSVNQASINQEDVKSLEILVPPLSLQNQFAAFVERVDQQKQTVQQSLEKLELMKNALMQEYFG